MSHTPADAERIIFENLPGLSSTGIPVSKAYGRILRQGLVADRDAPPFDRVMMDGYALRWKELRRMDGRRFHIRGFAAAGMPALEIAPTPFSCVEVATGAMLPAGADTVVPYEMTERLGDEIRLSEEGENLGRLHAVHARGSDCPSGREFVTAGLIITAPIQAAAAACGVQTLTVASIPPLRIVATGDELVGPGVAPEPWQLRRSNDCALTAALAGAGFPGAKSIYAKDTEASTVSALKRALVPGAWVITIGGVSKGRTDHVPAAFKKLGVFMFFRGILQRPGKPFAFGVAPGGNPVFALPGNPASAFVCLHRYIIPALLKASEALPSAPMVLPLAETVRSQAGTTVFIPANPEYSSSRLPVVRHKPLNTSGDFLGLIGSSGFIEIPPGTASLPAGAPVHFRPW